MKILLIISLICFVWSQDTKSDGCEVGWHRYKEKCVIPLDISATFDEAKIFCETEFKADILNITSNDERIYWSFYLMRYTEIKNNVWINNTIGPNNFGINSKKDECVALKSKFTENTGLVGDFIVQNCKEEGAVVCQVGWRKPKPADREMINLNENFIPNARMNLSNGDQSNFYSGTYYVLISKFKNATFSSNILGNGRCKLGAYDIDQDCYSINEDERLKNKEDHIYDLTQIDGDKFQIRRFDSKMILIYEPETFLSNFECSKDGMMEHNDPCLNDIIRKTDYNGEYRWKIFPTNYSDYYIIQSNHENLTLGAIEYLDKHGNMSIGFGLYSQIGVESSIPDKFLFKIEHLNYTFDVQVYSVEFDNSLGEMLSSSSSKISLVDTTTINNNSPAQLTHQVHSEKQVTESFSTSFDTAQSYMQSLSDRNEIGSSTSDTSSKSKSFTDQTSHAVSHAVSQMVSDTDSSTDETHSSQHDEVGGEAGFSGFGAHVSAKYSHSWDRGSSNSKTHLETTEKGNTDTTNDENGHSDTENNEKGHSNTTNVNHAKENTKQHQTSTVKRFDQGGSTSRTYSIDKTVNLPPYTAVKISSYANFIDDASIKFKLILKFTASSFRRSKDGKAVNSWRTMDRNFVEHLMINENFPGKIRKTTPDAIYGEIEGSMQASVGLDSVFMAKETKISKGI